MQARQGELVDVLAGDGCAAVLEGRPSGLITWFVAEDDRRADPDAEVRALAVASDARGHGVGRALLAATEQALRARGVRRAWLVTTNDNLTALALYQKAGWHLSEVRAGAVDELRRRVKPSLPEIGQHGIPLRDELELSKVLG